MGSEEGVSNYYIVIRAPCPERLPNRHILGDMSIHARITQQNGLPLEYDASHWRFQE